MLNLIFRQPITTQEAEAHFLAQNKKDVGKNSVDYTKQLGKGKVFLSSTYTTDSGRFHFGTSWHLTKNRKGEIVMKELVNRRRHF